MKATGVLLAISTMSVISFFPMGTAGQQAEYTTPINVDPASKARIEFIEKYWDFGVVPGGNIVYHNFPLRNVGSDTLVITRVKPTCGCTGAPLSTDRIAPGDTAKISVSLDTSKLHGKVRKYVNVDCNDPINPYYKITFDAKIDSLEQIIAIKPLVADFGDFQNGHAPKIDLKITNTGSSPLNLSIADKPDGGILTAVFGKTELGSKETTTLSLELIAEVDSGLFASTIAIESVDDTATRISVPILGNVLK